MLQVSAFIQQLLPMHYLTEENARKTVESGLDRLIISIDGTTQEYMNNTG